jgi:hypothetical protein
VEYFDDLMLMCKGKVVYHGTMAESCDYFAEIGYPCPGTHTPTDFFMTLLQDSDIADILIKKWEESLEKRNPAEYAYTAPVQVTNESFTEKYLTSYAAAARGTMAIEFVELLKRAMRSVVRNKLLIGASIIQNLVFGLLVGLLFINLTDNVTGIADRFGLLFIVMTNVAFSSVMSMINNFPPQKAVFIRDQQSGAYSPLLYFITMSLAELPLQVFTLFLQAVLVYWMTHLLPTAQHFFLYYAVTLALQQVGVGFGLAISTAIDSYIVASGVTPMIIIPFMLAGGLLASTDRLRPYWYWLEKPSFIRAGFILLLKNEFEDLGSISCNPDKFGASFCSRQPQNGMQVLDEFGFNDSHGQIWVQWVILAGIFVVARLICVMFLYRIAHQKN